MATVVEEKTLEVKDLKTYFYTEDGEVRAVDGMSYNVRQGECVGLVGESGCGKSVSSLSILRLVPYPPGIIVGGEIIFKGQDLLKLSEPDMRRVRGDRIALVFQEPWTSLNPSLTIRLQLSESLELHRGLSKKAAAEEAIKLLQLVGIPDAERRIEGYAHHFSGGMQQRIMIAMALSCNPELLIADEPTTSVDVTVQAEILQLLDKLRAQFGSSLILITHNMGVVARHADRVNIMYAGRIVETASTDTLFGEPKHPYTVGLMASVPRLDQARDRDLFVIGGTPPNLARRTKGCSFYPRCYLAIDWCRKEKPEMEEVGEEHYSACFRSGKV